MLSFEEFVLREAPKKIPDQQMGFNDKKKNANLRDILIDGNVVGIFKGLDVYQSDINNMIYIGCLINDTVLYTSVFKRFDHTTIQQVSVWRDTKASTTRGIIEYVIFNIILKKFNLMSDTSQTVAGNVLWTKTLLPKALDKKLNCCVINASTNVEFPLSDKSDINSFNDNVYGTDPRETGKIDFINFAYKIYKGGK